MTFVAFTNNIMIKVGLTRLTTETPSLEGKSAKGDVVVVGVSLYLEEIVRRPLRMVTQLVFLHRNSYKLVLDAWLPI